MDKQSIDWAILVYISADRVLTNFAVESLKQLKRSAGNGIIALAQMQATDEAEAKRYVFNGTTDPNSSIEDDRPPSTEPAHFLPGGISNPQNLTEFLKWASTYEAKHRCLFLWGHGYELLLNDDQSGIPQSGVNTHGPNGVGTVQNGVKPGMEGQQTGGKDQGVTGRNYLAPRSLKNALEKARPFAGILDIVGIDACSLCLVELAGELGDSSKFLIASQEDVPDASFPYERLLTELKGYDRDNVEGICTAIPRLYAEAYQDYVVAPGTGMKEITLSSLRLKNIGGITEPLTGLAAALLSSAGDRTVRKTVLAARKAARDFALGLFVDLRDFCFQLSANLQEGDLRSACDAVLRAIDARDFIAANETGDGAESRCHGLSIYLPYLTQAEMDKAHQSMMAATSLVDQAPLLVKGGTNQILKARGVQISQIEGDFESLVEFKKTGWSEFIRHGWSVILASEEPNELDQHYSGEQCAINLLSLLKPSDPKSDSKPSHGLPLQMAAVATKT